MKILPVVGGGKLDRLLPIERHGKCLGGTKQGDAVGERYFCGA